MADLIAQTAGAAGAKRLRRRPRADALASTPLGALVARPWLDGVTLNLLRDWALPMSRAWAAATVAGGALDTFLAELPLPRTAVLRVPGLARALTLTAAAEAALHRADAAWSRAFFGPDEGADLVALEDGRLDAAQALAALKLRFALFARLNRLEACRWEVASPAEVMDRHGSRLAHPATAYAIPDPAPTPAVSRRVPSEFGTEYWLRVESGDPAVDTPCHARVFEPAGARATVIHLHGICLEPDQVRLPLREVEALARRGLRVIAPEAPFHGRRRLPGRYGGEPTVARGPLGLLDHFAAHLRELAALTGWARQAGGAVGWSGLSLGAFTCQLALVHAATWPAAMRPDAALLLSTSQAIGEIALDGAFGRAFGLNRVLRRSGWTAETMGRWHALTDPTAPPAIDPRSIFMALGTEDVVAPFPRGLDLARRWQIPENQLFLRRQGHFSLPLGLLADQAPIEALARRLDGGAAAAG